MFNVKEFLGEAIGTFIMVFFGVGAVGVTVLYGSHQGTMQIALIWGIAIALAIFATRYLSNAHFNTAVSIAMCASGRMSWKKLPMYFIGQMVGAMVAALALWALLGASVSANLGAAGTAGYLDPSKISSIWCETYPNSTGAVVPTPVACLAEGLGTFFVVALIFAFTEGANLGKPTSAVQPLFIGFIIAMVICVVGPLTNAGLNPARDLGPRIIGALMGFGGFAFSWQVILVYTVSPIIGGLIGAFATVLVIEPVCKRAKAQEVADAQKGQGEQNIQEVKTKRVGTIM